MRCVSASRRMLRCNVGMSGCFRPHTKLCGCTEQICTIHTQIQYAGMAELADALDSGDVTLVTISFILMSPPSERSLRVKINDPIEYAGMAELADALDSGSSESNFMEVQVLLPAPKSAIGFRLLFLFSKWRNWQVSLRLGHAPALTVHRTVIHYRRAASLRPRFRF